MSLIENMQTQNFNNTFSQSNMGLKFNANASFVPTFAKKNQNNGNMNAPNMMNTQKNGNYNMASLFHSNNNGNFNQTNQLSYTMPASTTRNTFTCFNNRCNHQNCGQSQNLFVPIVEQGNNKRNSFSDRKMSGNDRSFLSVPYQNSFNAYESTDASSANECKDCNLYGSDCECEHFEIQNIDQINNEIKFCEATRGGKKKTFNTTAERMQFRQQYESKKKTELCRNFEMYGKCKFGDNCSYAHGKFQLQKKTHLPSNFMTKLCTQFHQDGFCTYGERCQFLHSIYDRKTELTYPQALKEGARLTHQRNTQIGDDSGAECLWANLKTGDGCGAPKKPRLAVFEQIYNKEDFNNKIFDDEEEDFDMPTPILSHVRSFNPRRTEPNNNFGYNKQFSLTFDNRKQNSSFSPYNQQFANTSNNYQQSDYNREF